MPLSQETLNRLEKFKASDRYINLSPETKTRLDNFLAKSMGQSTSEYSPMAKEYFARQETPVAPKKKGLLATYLSEAQPAFRLAISHPETILGKPAVGPTGKPLTPEELEAEAHQEWSDVYRKGAGVTGKGMPFAKSTSTVGQLVPQIVGLGLDVGTRPSSYIIPTATARTAAFAAKTPATRAILSSQTPVLSRGLLATTPPETLTGIGGLAQRGLNKILPTPEKMISKAEKLTTEILQPPKGELASYLARGRKMPAIEESIKVIKKSRNYAELNKNFDNIIEDTMNRRNKLLEQYDILEGNKPLGDYTRSLKSYIQKEINKGQSTSSEIKQMQDVLNREIEFLKRNPLNRVKGQARKEYLQDITDALLQKTEKGDIIDTQPARNRALDQLRRGLKQEVERGLTGESKSYVSELNSRYGGLRRAKELIAGQEALAQKAIPDKNIIQTLIRIILRPQDVGAEVAKGALSRQSSLAQTTNKISQLMKIANQAK